MTFNGYYSLTHRRTGGDVSAGVEVGRRIRGEGYPDTIGLLYASARRFNDAEATHEQATHQLPLL